jgi:nucleotide-binding universal stress UspA family protein
VEVWRRPGIPRRHQRISAQVRGARSVARRARVDAAFHARLGDPAPSIARFARSMKCTEIIMGTRGRSRMASLVLGSVAMRVVQLTDLPVTLVK